MDKNKIIGFLFLVGICVLVFVQKPSKPLPEGKEFVDRGEGEATSPTPAEEPASFIREKSLEVDALLSGSRQEESAEGSGSSEEIYVLENDYIAVQFTTRGGAIKAVAFKKYAAQVDARRDPGRDPYQFNGLSKTPALGMGIVDDSGKPRKHDKVYRLLSREEDVIRFAVELEKGIQIIRSYGIHKDTQAGDPYTIKHTTRFMNTSEEALALNKLYVELGTAAPSLSDSNRFAYYDGQRVRFINLLKFTGRPGFLGFFSKEPQPPVSKSLSPLIWAAVKNQFFTSILTSKTPGVGFYAGAENLSGSVEGNVPQKGITGSVQFEIGSVPAGGEQLLEFEYYSGPKEFRRLQAMPDQQEALMQFPPVIGFLSKLLLSFMLFLESYLSNWGWSIVVMTICIKILFWPLTAKSTRSQKAMQKLQAPLKEIREKYKDNPKKLQTEMMKLYREHKVNPVAGCLPLLIQMPIFFALFYMLRSASELRFAEFLWIKDLSQADTVAEIAGLPINVLPIIMGVTMFWQMQLAPTQATEAIQQKVFKFLPFVFFIICYNFSAGLVLYWTVQNLLTILQQKLSNRNETPDAAPAPMALNGPKAKKRKK